MKTCITLLLSAVLSFSVLAETAVPEQHDTEVTNPKQCLNELAEGDGTAVTDTLEDDKKPTKEPSWFDKLVKHHKLGSLHFQDIIEFFY